MYSTDTDTSTSCGFVDSLISTDTSNGTATNRHGARRCARVRDYARQPESAEHVQTPQAHALPQRQRSADAQVHVFAPHEEHEQEEALQEQALEEAFERVMAHLGYQMVGVRHPGGPA